MDFAAGSRPCGDEGLAAELDGEPLGQSVEEIEAQLGDSLSRLIQVRVRARLPGEVTSNATTKADNGAVWQVGFGEGTVDLEATGTQRRVASLALAGVAMLCAIASSCSSSCASPAVSPAATTSLTELTAIPIPTAPRTWHERGLTARSAPRTGADPPVGGMSARGSVLAPRTSTRRRCPSGQQAGAPSASQRRATPA